VEDYHTAPLARCGSPPGWHVGPFASAALLRSGDPGNLSGCGGGERPWSAPLDLGVRTWSASQERPEAASAYRLEGCNIIYVIMALRFSAHRRRRRASSFRQQWWTSLAVDVLAVVIVVPAPQCGGAPALATSRRSTWRRGTFRRNVPSCALRSMLRLLFYRNSCMAQSAVNINRQAWR
jgi:hypothetical protein